MNYVQMLILVADKHSESSETRESISNISSRMDEISHDILFDKMMTLRLAVREEGATP